MHACILVNAFHVQLFVIVVPHLDQRGGPGLGSIRIFLSYKQFLMSAAVAIMETRGRLEENESKALVLPCLFLYTWLLCDVHCLL